MAQGYTYKVLVNITKEVTAEEAREIEGYNEVGTQEFTSRVIRKVR